jgi:enterochelin esterase family protein
MAMGPVAHGLEPANAGGNAVAPASAPLGIMETIQSPVLTPDGHILFRIRAPRAATVELRGSMPSAFAPVATPLVRDADGVWSAQIDPLPPDIYFYNFYVDGLPVLDPGNPHSRRAWTSLASTFVVPGSRSAPYVVNPVPHGTVAQVWYHSRVLKEQRRAFVYTPPDYEQTQRRYPVLYLLHGGFGDEGDWVNSGRVPQILDNFIAGKSIQPMIVVMPNGNATQTAAPDYVEAPEPQGSFFGMAFPDSLVGDLLPFIDKTYRTRADRNNRAIAGLSMGGAHALWAAFHHIDKFAWVESMSGGYMILPDAGVYANEPPPAGLPANLRMPMAIDPAKVLADLPDLVPAAAARMRMFALTAGDKDPLVPQQRALQAELQSRGIHADVTEVSGFSHEWSFWRVALVDMLPRLFAPADVARAAQ